MSTHTPNPRDLAVLLDAARACYGDDSEQVRWLLNPDAVRELLRHTPVVDDQREVDGPLECAGCSAQCEEGSFLDGPHDRACPIAAAWRALGDPRGQEDIERAHEEALRERERRRATNIGRGRGSSARARAEELARSGRRVVFASATHGGGLLDYPQSRAESDARGMEAVEAEARLWCPSDEDDHRHNVYFRQGLYECMHCKQRSMPRYLQFDAEVDAP